MWIITDAPDGMNGTSLKDKKSLRSTKENELKIIIRNI
ncbi:MAG: hypothetical protein RIQ56_336 [Candidatus Parcubacteria bacterium]